MTVYVDNAFISATVLNGSARHTSEWCHLMADSTEELVEFAKRLGLRRGYIQHLGTWKEHFDVTVGKRAQAVRMGAVEVDSYELVEQAHVRFDLRNLL